MLCGIPREAWSPWNQGLSMWIGYQPKILLLGSTPDRIVYDPTSNPPFNGLEIKCIESGKGMTLLQTYLAKKEPESGKENFCLTKCEGNLRLNANHLYHHQVQGQCGVSGLKRNDFMLMTDQGVHVEQIYFDETWHDTSDTCLCQS